MGELTPKTVVRKRELAGGELAGGALAGGAVAGGGLAMPLELGRPACEVFHLPAGAVCGRRMVAAGRRLPGRVWQSRLARLAVSLQDAAAN